MEENQEDIKKSVQSALFSILQANPFLGGLLQEINMRFDNSCPTAYIGYDKRTMKFIMGLNPKFFTKLTLPQRQGVLTHEIMHFLRQHLFRGGMSSEDRQVQALWNICGDMEINQYIDDLPYGCDECKDQGPKYKCKNKECGGRGIRIQDWKDPKGQPLPVFQPMEVYFKLIQESLKDMMEKNKAKCKNDKGDAKGDSNDQEQQQDGSGSNSGNQENSGNSDSKKMGNGSGKQSCDGENCPKHGKGKPGPNDDAWESYRPFDRHDWEELSEEEKERMLKEAGELIKRSLEKVNHDYSLAPGYVKDLLESIENQIAKLDYKGILKRAIKRSVTVQDREGTWKRPNKRYGEYSQGTTVGRLPNIDVYIDTSGSMSIKEINESLHIMSGFLQVGGKSCKLGLWHTDLYHFKRFKLKEDLDKKEIQSGGTDPLPMLKHIKKTKPNLAIVLTDGHYEADPKFVLEGQDIIWIIRNDNNIKHPYLHLGKTVLYSALGT